MHFSLYIPSIAIALLAFGFVALMTGVWWQWARASRLKRFATRYEGERDYTDEFPAVSIVVSAHNDAECLQSHLPAFLEQDYPADFEVVVVDDGSCDTSGDALSEIVARYGNLRVTFIPDNTRALSRTKLSLTLGIKAARHDVIITTCANCYPDSDQWLRLMMRNFTPDTDVVVGYSHIEADCDHRFGSRFRAFDATMTAMQWINGAIKGNTYRGDGNNLAYRKRCFFDHKGFASTLNLLYGEDDIFVSEITDGSNTRVELASDAMMTVVHENAALAHRRLKLRRNFTSRMLPRKPFAVQGLMSLLTYAGLASVAAAVTVDHTNTLTAIIAAVTVVSSAAALMPAVKQCCSLLQSRPLCVTAPFFAVWRPLVNALYVVRGAHDHKSNYTSIIN